jgi:hypothetical protein
MFSDRDIAVRILALEECGSDESPTDALAHFDKQFDQWGTDEHSGDCKKQPWTCCRCVHDETMKRVPGARMLFGLI